MVNLQVRESTAKVQLLPCAAVESPLPPTTSRGNKQTISCSGSTTPATTSSIMFDKDEVSRVSSPTSSDSQEDTADTAKSAPQPATTSASIPRAEATRPRSASECAQSCLVDALLVAAERQENASIERKTGALRNSSISTDDYDLKQPTEQSIESSSSFRSKNVACHQQSESADGSQSKAEVTEKPTTADFSPDPNASSNKAAPKSRKGTTTPSSSSNQAPPLKVGAPRRGKWTAEEEAYVARVIQDFNSGFLDAPAGTTLRTYLSEKLKCDPMRITKKFTGENCIGKRVFHPAVLNATNTTAIAEAQAELDALEKRWRRRLEMQQRESAKKAAASAAVAAAATSGRRQLLGTKPTELNAAIHQDSFPPCTSNDLGMDKGGTPGNPVTQTAAWLDRAKSALGTSQQMQHQQPSQPGDLQYQMHEVQRLIHEGPGIQRRSADIPQMLDAVTPASATDAAKSAETSPGSPGTPEEPADKRMRTTEGAEALVGFIRSVQASAAAKGGGGL